MRTRLANVRRPVLFAVALVLTAFSYTNLLRLAYLSNEMGGGLTPYLFLVPCFSLYCLFRERRTIRASVGEPSVIGLLLLVPCILLGWIGGLMQQVRFEIVALLASVLALVWAFFGIRTVRAVLFPVCYLSFCLYFCVWFSRIDGVPSVLRRATDELIRLVAQALGCFVFDRGPFLVIPELGLTLDTTAFGFGSTGLNPSILVVATLSYFLQPTNPRRLLLVALDFPFVVVANAVLSVSGGFGGEFLVLAVCGLLCVPASWMITKGARRCGGV